MDDYELKKLISELKNIEGRHTELLSIYIPAGYNIQNILSQLSSEAGTASSIEDKTVLKNVTAAIEHCIQTLRSFKETPRNGLALFCGNVSEREGVQDLKVWSIEPPEPLTKRLYQCDKIFITKPLEELIDNKDAYGLIVMDNREATIAILKGSHYSIVKHMSSEYHGKHKAGGQSHSRFERIIDNQSHAFKQRIADKSAEILLPMLKDLKGIIIGGCAMTKDDFVNGDFLHHELKKKILAVKDVGYTDEQGIKELIDKSADIIQETEIVKQRDLFHRFMKELVNDGKFTYGFDVEECVRSGSVDVVLLSENVAPETKDAIYESAKEKGAKVEFFNADFEEGNQLWLAFGGKAAILRYS